MPDAKHLSILQSPHIHKVKKKIIGSKLEKMHDAVPLSTKYSMLALENTVTL